MEDAVRFWTSDHHFGHGNIIKYAGRPFASVLHMNEMMVYHWNNTVSPDDTVMILGDLVMGHAEENLGYVTRLNGHKKLIAGNHDRVWDGNTKPGYVERWQPLYEAAGLEIVSHGEVYYAPISKRNAVSACHFPYDHDERHGDRFADWHPVDVGDWLIHGHVHGEWKVRGRQINVGVDVWDFKPVGDQQLLDIIEGE
jgi:calcineurin-like phosphoesterase family protein